MVELNGSSSTTAISPKRPWEDTVLWNNEQEIWFAQSAPLTGLSKKLGTEMRDGILAAFEEVNSMGGVWNNKKLKLLTLDDAYEPTNTKINTDFFLYNTTPPTSSLIYQPYLNSSSPQFITSVDVSKIFGLIGYVGTPTVSAVFPDVTKTSIPLLGSFTGVGWLRTPFYPNVINLRASYDDETAAMVDWLVNTKLIRRISIMYQNDAFGIAGFNGINRSLVSRMNISLCSTGLYTRNTLAVEDAFYTIGKCNPEAIVLVGTYAPLSKYIKMVKNVAFSANGTNYGYEKASEMIFLTVSFVGSAALTDDLNQSPLPSLKFASTYYTDNVIISQVVPSPMDLTVPVVRSYHRARKAYLKATGKDVSTFQPTFIELEGYLTGKLAYSMLKTIIGDLTRSNFIATSYIDYTAGNSETNNGGSFVFDGTKVNFKWCESANVYDQYLPFSANATSVSCASNCNQGLKIVYLSSVNIGKTPYVSNVSFSVFKQLSWYEYGSCISDTSILKKPIIFGQSIEKENLQDEMLRKGIQAAFKRRNSKVSSDKLQIELKTLYHNDSSSLLFNTRELKNLHESVALVGFTEGVLNLDGINNAQTLDIKQNSEYSDIASVIAATNLRTLRSSFYSPVMNLHLTLTEQLGTLITYSMKQAQSRMSVIYKPDCPYSSEAFQTFSTMMNIINLNIDSQSSIINSDSGLKSLDTIIDELTSNANPQVLLITLFDSYDSIVSILSKIQLTYTTNPVFRKGLSIYLINSYFSDHVETKMKSFLAANVNPSSPFQVFYVSHIPSFSSSSNSFVTEFNKVIKDYYPSDSSVWAHKRTLEGYYIGKFITTIVDTVGNQITKKSFMDYVYTQSVIKESETGITFGAFSKSATNPCNLGLRTGFLYSYSGSVFTETFTKQYDTASCAFQDYKGTYRRSGLADSISSVISKPIIFGRLIPYDDDSSTKAGKLDLISEAPHSYDAYSRGLQTYLTVYNSKASQKIEIHTEYFSGEVEKYGLEYKLQSLSTKQGVFGFFGSNLRLSVDQYGNVTDILKKYQIPMFVLAGSLEYRKPYSKYFINWRPSVFDEVIAQMKYFKQTYGQASILYSPIGYYTTKTIPSIKEYIENYDVGLEVFDVVSNPTSTAIQLSNQNIEAVIILAHETESISWIEAILSFNPTIKIAIPSETYSLLFEKGLNNLYTKHPDMSTNFLIVPRINIAPVVKQESVCSSVETIQSEKKKTFINQFLANYQYSEPATHETLEGYLFGFFLETVFTRIYQEKFTSTVTLPDFFSTIFSNYVYDIAGLTTMGPFGLECSSTNNVANITVATGDCATSYSSASSSCDCNQGPRSVLLSSLNVENGTTSFTDISFDFSFSTCGVAIVPPAVTKLQIAMIVLSLVIFFSILGCIGIIYWRYLKTRQGNTTYAPKTGNIACAFTDVQNSTVLWEADAKAMREALKLHNEVLRKNLEAFRGFEVKTNGDSFYVVFKSAVDALDWSIACQHDLMACNWPPELLQQWDCRTQWNEKTKELIWNGLRVRIGLHFGQAEQIFDKTMRRPDYYGTTINTSARIEAAAHGGQKTKRTYGALRNVDFDEIEKQDSAQSLPTPTGHQSTHKKELKDEEVQEMEIHTFSNTAGNTKKNRIVPLVEGPTPKSSGSLSHRSSDNGSTKHLQ
ncbi:predicted protein [Naegleria gruberi]|uniref:Predicted protein n=1 Tax=Naegleria gruberi TaxID=5762 RepID=D2VRX6_NAEGR|nr:uncharacterized protein NAEGRDRAFT_71740 [Naegleria gruberi]EFC40540.1 predicted protein [Naegleria gruberi]|eukprot:XP_002673284.1 predicted protein [Naegleria gruberi strain NEG-M]